jgi:hypothetical protein
VKRKGKGEGGGGVSTGRARVHVRVNTHVKPYYTEWEGVRGPGSMHELHASRNGMDIRWGQGWGRAHLWI